MAIDAWHAELAKYRRTAPIRLKVQRNYAYLAGRAWEKRPWNAPGSSTIEIRIGRDRRLQRTTNTGTGLFARTSDVWLPSSSFLKPLRPCDAMTIKLQPRALAKSSIASAG